MAFDKFKDGDDIHHLNRDHDNNDPANLVLIEHTDHMMLHGGRTMARLKGRPQKKKSAEALARRNRRKLYKKIAGRWKPAA
jgi:HNH endonuclease